MEKVVLVDKDNNPIGAAEKNGIHTDATPLHRGFSVFLFNSKKQILVTRRSSSKRTFPGIWSNTVCGHPAPDELVVEAAKRRLKDELGLYVLDVKEVAPYRYRFADENGIVENEICPVLVARSDAYPSPNPNEIVEWKWMPWSIFLQELKEDPGKYSPWSREEAQLIENVFKQKPWKTFFV